MTTLLISSAGLIASTLLLAWLISLPLKDVSIIDILWGPGFVLVAWAAVLLSDAPSATAAGTAPSRWLLPLLATVWGVRLGGYLAWRKIGEPEDRRYAEMRKKRGRAFWWQSLFIVCLLQGVAMWVISLPLQFGIARAQPEWHWSHAVGIMLWTVGLIFEAGGDWQLARFLSRPDSQGRVLDRGLWRYTRHPNYFGDSCIWWGMSLVAVAGHPPDFWWLLICPLLMTALLLWFSGVLLLEQSLPERRPAYADYIRRTSAFFPWPPRPHA